MPEKAIYAGRNTNHALEALKATTATAALVAPLVLSKRGSRVYSLTLVLATPPSDAADVEN